ncbi:MAG: response regulator transcription factor [Tissierellia bacterium]|nr:response regulator transcription factor [Tissierellia bacterium]
MARILVVDDEADLLQLVKQILEREGHRVATYESPLEVPREELGRCDLILLDVMMPGMDGLAYCREIRPLVDGPIVFLTAKSQEAQVVEGFSAGGDDYIVKPFGVEELSARVAAHLRREHRERHHHLHRGKVHLDLSAREISVGEELIPLTKSEYEICELLAKRRGQVFSREQIYQQIFGWEGTGEASAISEHIKNIRGKFQKHGEQPIATVWGIGYKWQ